MTHYEAQEDPLNEIVTSLNESILCSELKRNGTKLH